MNPLNPFLSSSLLGQGGRRQLPRLERPPPGVVWRLARPKPADEPVRASLARSTGYVETIRGPVQYLAGKHYIVRHGPGELESVRRALFDRTHRRRRDGRFEVRPDAVLRYFTLPYPVIVETPEGAEFADRGDWIVDGTAGALWPISARDAHEKYDSI